MEKEKPVLLLVCGGAPVPGLNAMISAVAMNGNRMGWEIMAVNDGYVHLATGDPDIVKENSIILTEENTRHISRLGGSIIRCDRFDPTISPEYVENIHKMLKYFKVRYLLIAGGSSKIQSANFITRGCDPYDLKVLVIPKTIDNDVPIPAGMSTFGYHSAFALGSRLIKNLIQDAHAVPRWHIAVVMGRQTGHLAYEIAAASGAQLAIIPEDFGRRRVSLEDICDIFEGVIYKRLRGKRNYGVLIVCEGIVNKLTAQSIQKLFAGGFITYNQAGEIVLEDADIGRAIRQEMTARMQERGIILRFNSLNIGYELRSCPPVSFDEIYSQDLGFAAIEGFRQGKSNCVVIWDNGEVFYWSFRDIVDYAGRVIPRKVDIQSEHYIMSRSLMWHLTKADFESEATLAQLAKMANVTPEQFYERFKHVPSLTVC